MTPETALRDRLAERIFSIALDRLDKVGSQDRTKVLRIGLDRQTAPEIFDAGTNDDRAIAWHVLEVLEKEGLGKIVMRKTQRHGGREDRQPAFDVSTTSAAEDRLRGVYGRPRPGPGRHAEWRALVDGSDLPDAAKLIVGANPITIRDRMAADVFAALLSIRRDHRPDGDALLREVSSRAFWGLSKVLDGRGDLVAVLLGEIECPYPEQPVHLDVYVVGEFSWILFVENKTTFERCIREARTAARAQATSRYDGAALIYSSGFMGAARRLRSANGARRFYAIDAVSNLQGLSAFESAFLNQPDVAAAFWGDLDHSGMSILARLRSTFPSAVAWEPGYAPMLEALEVGGGHLPEEARKEGQRALSETGCPYADGVLIPALARSGRFIDQE